MKAEDDFVRGDELDVSVSLRELVRALNLFGRRRFVGGGHDGVGEVGEDQSQLSDGICT